MRDEKRPTIEDVAKRAGVSTATVSMVMAGNPKISKQTRDLVIRCIDELHYTRRRRAKAGSGPSGQSGLPVVGLVTYCDYPFQWWFAREFIMTIKDELAKNGYLMVLFDCTCSTDPDRLYAEIVFARLQGLIVLQYNDAGLFAKIQDLGLPMVLINNSNYQFRYHSVCADDFQGAYDGTTRLIENGHTHIGFLDFFRPNQPATVFERYFGFRKAMEEYLLPFPNNHRITVALHDSAALEEALRQLFSLDPEVSAFFVHDDYFALDVLHALSRIGKRVPDDISIIAPGDTIPYGEPFVPEISTMQLNQKEMGTETVSMLVSLLSGELHSVGIKKSQERFVDRRSIRNLKES